MAITVRRVEPTDFEALQRLYSGQRVIWGTAQLPYPSVDMWRKRLAEPPEGMFGIVACIDDQVVGHLNIHTSPHRAQLLRLLNDLGVSTTSQDYIFYVYDHPTD